MRPSIVACFLVFGALGCAGTPEPETDAVPNALQSTVQPGRTGPEKIRIFSQGHSHTGSKRLPEQLSMDLEASICGAWRTNSRITTYLIEGLPEALWDAPIPGISTRSIRSIAAHLHNSRCNWVKTLGREHGIRVPASVDRCTVTQRKLLSALPRSAEGIGALLELGCAQGGRIPASRAYVWRNLPLDVGHVLSYFVAHEGHHRGQIVMSARQLQQRLPRAVTDGLWQFIRRSREADASG